jgi:hypothetical protein
MGAIWYSSLSIFGFTIGDLKSIRKLKKIIPNDFHIHTLLTEHHSRMEYDDEGMEQYAVKILGFNMEGMEVFEIAEKAEKLIAFVNCDKFKALNVRISEKALCVSGIEWNAYESDCEEEEACGFCNHKIETDALIDFGTVCSAHRSLASLLIIAKTALPRVPEENKVILSSMIKNIIDDKFDVMDETHDWYEALIACSEFIEPQMMGLLSEAERFLVRLIENATCDDSD